MIGIYSLTSPSGKIYIGQTYNSDERTRKYSQFGCKGQTMLYHSLLKYGYDKHTFKMLHELPADISLTVMNEYEIFYIQQYKDCGFEVLNLKLGGGGGGKHCEATKIKIGLKNKGRIATEERKKQMSKAMMGRPSWNKGKGGYKQNLTEEQRSALSIRAKNRTWCKHSDETKLKMSLQRIGKPGHTLGKKLSEEHKRKLSIAHTGKTVSKETRQKISKNQLGRPGTNTKLSEQQVYEIKALLLAGVLSQYRIAKNYGVHKVTIFDIKHGKSWCHVKSA